MFNNIAIDLWLAYIYNLEVLTSMIVRQVLKISNNESTADRDLLWRRTTQYDSVSWPVLAVIAYYRSD